MVESNLKIIQKTIKITMLNKLKNIKHTFITVFLTQLFVLMINLTKKLFLLKENMRSMNLLKQHLKNIIIERK